MPRHDRASRMSEPARLQLSVRTVIIVLLALAAGVVTSGLLWATAVPMAQALLGGIASGAAALRFFDKIIEAAPRT